MKEKQSKDDLLKKYQELKQLQLNYSEVKLQYKNYFQKYHDYLIKLNDYDLNFYFDLFKDIKKSYFYFGKNDEDLKKVGCFFLHYFPLKVYGKGDPRTVRNYKSIFAQLLIDDAFNTTKENNTSCTSLSDLETDFIIIYATELLIQFNQGYAMLSSFISQRSVLNKPVLFLSTKRMPQIEMLNCIEYRSYDSQSFSSSVPHSVSNKKNISEIPVVKKQKEKKLNNNIEKDDYFFTKKDKKTTDWSEIINRKI